MLKFSDWNLCGALRDQYSKTYVPPAPQFIILLISSDVILLVTCVSLLQSADFP